MTIEEQWSAMEAEGVADGWRLQLARPLKDHPLFVALDGPRRALLLRVASSFIPPRHAWPACAGLEVVAVQLSEHTYLGVALKESRFRDVFTALAEDLVRRIEKSPSPNLAVETLLGELRRWQKFLAASGGGLSLEAQRGLWGELQFLSKFLLPALGESAVDGWTGPAGAHQDFQYAAGSIEVKTTLATQPQVVRITSERQLDDAHIAILFLHTFALDVLQGGMATLPAAVDSVRTALASHSAAAERFEDALLAAGYFDVHAPRYAGTGYVIRSATTFRVAPGFPRLVESDLPSGVGDAHYGLSLAACDSFTVPSEAMTAALTGGGATTTASLPETNPV